MTKRLSLLVLVAAGACSRDSNQKFAHTFDPCLPTVISLPADASDAQKASVEEALGMWRQVAWMDVSVGDVGEQVIPLDFEKAAPAFYGIYEDQIEKIAINQDITDDHERSVVIAHELGHALGLYHVYGRTSVMNTPNTKTPPQESDGAELVTTWGVCAGPAR